MSHKLLTGKRITIISNTDGAQFKFRGELIKQLKYNQNIVTSISSDRSPEGSYIDQLELIASFVFVVPFFRQGLKCLATPFKLYKILKRGNSDIIHIYGHESLLFSTFAILLFKKPAIIVTITGLGRFFSTDQGVFKNIIKKTILFLYQLLLNRLDKIIFLNEHDLKYFTTRFKYKSHKFIRIHGEGSAFTFNSLKPKENTSCRNFLFASRLMKEKGILELIETFLLLPKDFKLNILGSIDSKIKNEELIKSLLNSKFENIKYHGFVKDINSFMDSCECIVLPSKYLEGLPIILVEALAKGKMIITSHSPGCKETVIPGSNGLVIDNVTKSNLTKAILEIQELDLKEASKVSINLFETKFSSEIINNKIMNIYKSF